MPDSPEVVRSKATLRTRLLARRAARPPAERQAAAASLARTLREHLTGAAVVAAYVPAPEEPGADRLPGAIAAVVDRLLLPVVPATGRELGWAVATGPLHPGRFGLLEPPGPRLPPAELGTATVVVVPALAVARDGTRLGRGGGYYDRALAHAGPGAQLVAAVFDDELLDELPAGEHDRPVTAVVTPGGGWRQLAG